MQEGSSSLCSNKLFAPVVIIFILCAVGCISMRSIKTNLFCAEDLCSAFKDYTSPCMIDKKLYCCGGSLGVTCGSYSNCQLIPTRIDYSMCTPFKVTFWILFAVGLLSIYAGIFIARSFYGSKSGGLLQ